MSEMWQGILWGVLLAIPVGLIVNIVSSPIQRGIDRQTGKASARRSERNAEFKHRARHLAKDRNALYVELLEVLLRIAYITALFGVLSGAAFLLGQAIPYMGYLTTGLLAAGQLVALVGTLIVLNIARPAIVLVREVRSIREGNDAT